MYFIGLRLQVTGCRLCKSLLNFMMNKKIFAFFFLISINFSFSNQLQDQFIQANKLYQDGQFEEAIETYESIIINGYESGALYFNLANAYYKSGNISESRINYERSLLWLEGDEDVKQNLDLLKLRLVDQIEPTPKFFINVWWDEVVKFFNMDILGYIVLVLLWILLLNAASFLHYRKRGRQKFGGVFVISLIICLIAVSIWTTKIYQFETVDYGVILSSTVTIYSGPADNSTELFVIHEGTKVKIERSASDWFEIRLEDGKTGWLAQNVLEII